MPRTAKARKRWGQLAPADRKCCYCDRTLTRPNGNQDPSDASIDHYTPKCREKHLPGTVNLVLSCAACNAAKGDMDGFEFRYFLECGEIHQSYIEWLKVKIRKNMER